MKIVGVPAEVHSGERRVAISPQGVGQLVKLGFEVIAQRDCGRAANLPSADYEEAGARLVDEASEIWSQADMIIKIRPPTEEEVAQMKEGGTLIAMLAPSDDSPVLAALAAKGATAIALEKVPRISRAQKMDVLSSMANIAGYRAVLEATHLFGGFMGPQMTAAGKTPPAKVLVIGAGVAGLSAIATGRGLGAEVRAFDVRPAVKEQVESLGGRFLMLDFEESGDGGGGYAKTMSDEFIAAEMALFLEQAKEVDIIVTTALIPGRPAPLLITEEMVRAMKPGSVVVDLAAEQGGNCACTVPEEIVDVDGVKIIGYTDLTSRLPNHASRFFSNNVLHLLKDMVGDEGYQVDLEDEVVHQSAVVLDGALRWPVPAFPKSAMETVEKAPPAPAPPPPPPPEPKASAAPKVMGALATASLVAAGIWAPPEFLQHLTVFVLSCFVGWQVIWNVSHALHTPLMSVTNAISGIIVVGGILQATKGDMDTSSLIAAVAILVATINIAGGFLVTQRMLQMFRKEGS